MKIEKYGAGRRQDFVAAKLAELSPNAIERILLLPIPTTRDGVHLSGCDIRIDDVLYEVGRGDAVVGYAIPEADAEIIEASGGVCIDLSRDEEFLAENARLTALAAVGYILTEFPRAADEVVFGVVGYGRIGKILVTYLTSLGVKVIVYTSKKATRVALGACGIRTELYERDSRSVDIVPEVAVLINTAPTPLENSFQDGVIPDGLCVIELASGNNFNGVSGVIRLSSLPEKTYPDSAAEVYYRAVLRRLEALI